MGSKCDGSLTGIGGADISGVSLPLHLAAHPKLEIGVGRVGSNISLVPKLGAVPERLRIPHKTNSIVNLPSVSHTVRCTFKISDRRIHILSSQNPEGTSLIS